MEQRETTGRCLCGAVRFAAQARGHVDACHCSMCRRWGGGPLLAVDCGSEVQFSGAEHITRFASSDWAERGFCARCGSHLFYRVRQSGEYIMPAGLLDDADDLVFKSQIFVDEKPAYYDFANETENMTGAEVFAKYMP